MGNGQDGWVMAGDAFMAKVYEEVSQLQMELVPEEPLGEDLEAGPVLTDEVLRKFWQVGESHRRAGKVIADEYKGKEIPQEVLKEFEGHKQIFLCASRLFYAQVIMLYENLNGMLIGVFKDWQIGWKRPEPQAYFCPGGPFGEDRIVHM